MPCAVDGLRQFAEVARLAAIHHESKSVGLKRVLYVMCRMGSMDTAMCAWVNKRERGGPVIKEGEDGQTDGRFGTLRRVREAGTWAVNDASHRRAPWVQI